MAETRLWLGRHHQLPKESRSEGTRHVRVPFAHTANIILGPPYAETR